MEYKILIGDDNPKILETMYKILSKENYQVLKSKNPRNILRKICEADLLITDQNYSKPINGIEIARKIRASSKEDLGIILASSEITPKMSKICKELNVETIIKTPENVLTPKFRKELIKKVYKYLQ